MGFDVATSHGRRADRRWNRMAVGNVFERLTRDNSVERFR